MDSAKVRAIVFQALNNAAENNEFSAGGYLHGMTAEHVANDLAAFDDDLEMASPHDIQPHVTEWMGEHIPA